MSGCVIPASLFCAAFQFSSRLLCCTTHRQVVGEGWQVWGQEGWQTIIELSLESPCYGVYRSFLLKSFPSRFNKMPHSNAHSKIQHVCNLRRKLLAIHLSDVPCTKEVPGCACPITSEFKLTRVKWAFQTPNLCLHQPPPEPHYRTT